MITMTVIGGYLGAGKTTLINRILKATTAPAPLAVLVNDFDALNVDAELIDRANASVMELTNGCVCCTIQDDLGGALEAMRNTGVQHVIIEASGVALPDKVAQYANTWPDYCRGGVYVVVDVVNIQRLLRDKFVKHLVDRQLQQADLLLLAKTDVADPPADILSYGKPTLDLQNIMGFDWLRKTPPSPKPSQPAEPINHPRFTTTELTDEVALERTEVQRFLEQNPQIRRAKGWFRDGGGDHWHLQAVGDTCAIEPSAARPVGLVFIHLASTQIDLEYLIKGAPRKWATI